MRLLLPALLGVVAAGSAAAAPSTSLTVTGAVLDPATYDAAALAALPQAGEAVTYTAAGAPVSAVFSGPTLQSLVAAAMVDTNLAARNAIIPYYLTATGSDGYRVVYALAEIDPNFAGGGASPPLVATSVNGGTLGAAGFARTTAPRDRAGGRYDSNLVNLDIEHASPIGPLPSGGGASTSFSLLPRTTSRWSPIAARMRFASSCWPTTMPGCPSTGWWSRHPRWTLRPAESA